MKLLAILTAQTGLLFAQSVTPPEIVRQVEPEYTAEARSRRLEGVVILYVEVNANGVPENVKVVRSLDAELDKKAALAVQQWRFKPAIKNGKPVTVSAQVDVQFRLPRYPLLPSYSPRPKEAPPVETDDTDPVWWIILP
jgi:TonB family protein